MKSSNLKFVGALLLLGFAQPLLAAGGVMAVNGEDVTREEYIWFMQQEKPGVIQFFTEKHQVQFGPGFWELKHNGLTPRELLQERTRERIVREKAEQLLFRELGLISDVSHPGFLDDLEKTNRERATAKAQGKVIYGPVTYDPLQYYLHRKATLQLRAREILAGGRLAASEADLRASYEQNRKRYISEAVSSWEIITVQSTGNASGLEMEKQIATAAKKIQARLKSGARVEQIKDEWHGNTEINVAAGPLTDVNGERLGEMFSDGDTIRRMQKLKPGRVAILPPNAGATRVVKCVARKPGEVQPFEKVRAQVQRRMLHDRYDALIAELAAKAKIQSDPAQIKLIPIE